MNDVEKLYEIYRVVSQNSSRLDTIENAIALLLTQNMIDEYKNIIHSKTCTNIIHIFFNCDDNKSPHSMNILYNKLAYNDSMEGRELLMDRILKEHSASRIQIMAKDIAKIKKCILSGRPEDASRYIKYGCIVSLNICNGENGAY